MPVIKCKFASYCIVLNLTSQSMDRLINRSNNHTRNKFCHNKTTSSLLSAAFYNRPHYESCTSACLSACFSPYVRLELWKNSWKIKLIDCRNPTKIV